MAFRPVEFRRGAFAAWWMYLIGLCAATLVVTLADRGGANANLVLLTIVYALCVGAPVALVATVVWSGPAYLLGRALRTVRTVWVHVAAFAVLGCAAGLLTIVVFAQISFGASSLPGLIPFAAVAAIAVPLAWWRAYRCAIRADGVPAAPPSTLR